MASHVSMGRAHRQLAVSVFKANALFAGGG
jgi:hypothetical protein